MEDVLGSAKVGTNGSVKVHGLLCSNLGLEDGEEIDEQTFTHLLYGENASGEKVTREHKVIGIDLTFSAPKSVSIAGLMTDKDPRIIEAHDLAVLETMREIESTHAYTRLTKTDKRYSGNMAFVTVRDGFNREHEPHLHTHVVVMNMTSTEGKILALDGREIMFQDFNKFWGGMYRAKMASRLKELGYSLTYLKNGEWRVNSVSLELEQNLSTRRQQILAEKSQGTLDMAAWRKTRKEKDPGIHKENVKARWEAIHQSTPHRSVDDNYRMALAVRERWFKEAVFSLEAQQERNGERSPERLRQWIVAARRASDHSGCPTKEAIFTEFLTEQARGENWDRFSIKQISAEFDQLVKAHVFVDMGANRFTTWELIRSEREWSERLQLISELKLDPDEAEGAISKNEGHSSRRAPLSYLQRSAVINIFQQAHSVIPVQGDAGAGKTTMLRSLNDVAYEHGIPVLGLAMQGVAAQNLEKESGIKSKTMVAFLSEKNGGPVSSSIIVVDEASMMDSRSFSQLLEKVDLRSSKVVLVGDVNQLESIGAGRPFGRIVEEVGPDRVVHLNENFRQKDERLREAVSLARKGMLRESLDILEAEGKILEVASKEKRLNEVAMLYDDETLIVVGTTADRFATNQRIRRALFKGDNRSSEIELNFSVPLPDGTEESRMMPVRVGETLVFLKNEYQEYDVRNGLRGKVSQVDKNSLTLVLEDQRAVQIDLGRYNHFDYGYALTSYKSQGLTFNKVVIESDTSQVAVNDMRHQYVNITRARNDVVIFTDDKEAMRDHAGIMQYKRDTLDNKTITLSAAKEMDNQLQRMTFESIQRSFENAENFGRAVVNGLTAADTPQDPLSQVKWVKVINDELLTKTKGQKSINVALQQKMDDAEVFLNNSKEFNNVQKANIAQFLASGKAEKLFMSDFLTSMSRVYAAAVILEKDEGLYLNKLTDQEKAWIVDFKRLSQRSLGREI